MKPRIKYYPTNDLCHYNYIKNISNFISNTFDKEKTYSDINDIMELYNVIKYIDDKSIPFSSDIKNSLSDFKQIANKKIAMFFNKILTNDNFHENYSKLDVVYHNDFWEILDITPYINSSNTNTISTLILSNDNLFSKILSKPNLVKKFDKVLTKKMLENPNLSTSILLDKFEYNKPNIFIPTSLSEENKQTIISNYIKNACSPELLYLIINFNSNKKIILYAPTFRNYLNISEQIKLFSLNAQKLVEAAEKRFGGQYILVTRVHPNIAGEFKITESDYLKDGSKYPDMQELLVSSDILITDFSSSLFDFMLKSSRIFLFASDYDNYKKYERELKFDPKKDLPFPFANSEEELISKVATFDEDDMVVKNNNLKDSLGICDDGHSAERVAKLLAQVIDGVGL